MIAVYAVGDASTALRLLGRRAILVSHAYIGTSFVPTDKVPLLVANASESWCDSGAFTYWQRALKGKPGPGITVDLWAEFIVANAATFTWFVTLDVIGDAEASLKNWLRLIDLVPSDVARKIVPVWHEGDPIEHLDAYDPDVRLVALGRVEGRKGGAVGKRKTFEFYDTSFEAYPKGQFHLLGNSNPETIEPYPARSFDATTWQRNAAYSEAEGWPWNRVSKDTRMCAHIEAIDTIRHRPVVKKQMELFARRRVPAERPADDREMT